MAHRAIEQVSPGMKIAANVCDHNGRVLLAAGTALEERHFRMFKMWGIRSVEIDNVSDPGQPVAEGSAPGNSLPEEVTREIEDLFRHNRPDHPAIVVLRGKIISILVNQQEPR